MLNFENLDKFIFNGGGRYEIPEIEPVAEYPQGDFIPMNYANSEKHPECKNVYCFVDDWCFDGEPVGGIVAVSSVGTQNNAESKRLFLLGYEEMMRRLSPAWVIFYGKVPVECDWNVIRIAPHYEKIVERRKNDEQNT